MIDCGHCLCCGNWCVSACVVSVLWIETVESFLQTVAESDIHRYYMSVRFVLLACCRIIIIIIIVFCNWSNFCHPLRSFATEGKVIIIIISLSFAVRSRNTRATRLTVVTFSSKSVCSFSDIGLNVTQFSSVRPSRLKMKSTHSHSCLALDFFYFLTPGIHSFAEAAWTRKLVQVALVWILGPVQSWS